jgi:hypothetical protein
VNKAAPCVCCDARRPFCPKDLTAHVNEACSGEMVVSECSLSARLPLGFRPWPQATMRVERPIQPSARGYNASQQWLPCTMGNTISSGKSWACLTAPSYIILHVLHCRQVRLAVCANDSSLTTVSVCAMEGFL